MPNWMEGTLHLRGKAKDIYRFLTKGVDKNDSYQDLDLKKIVDDQSEEGMVAVDFHRDPWIVDTKRAFLYDQYIEFEYQDFNDEHTISLSIRQAWGFHEEDWTALCKKYNLDIRVNGFECGMQFGQDIVVLRGDPEPMVDAKEITYNDWEWECPFPNMGG